MSNLETLEGIPDGSRNMFNDLAREELLDVAELFKQLRAYKQELTRASSVNDDVDADLARALAEASFKLLSIVGDDTSEEHRRAIQAAVRYLIIEDDAESDTESVIGLDDDTQVLNAVLTLVGHPEWAVELR